MQISQNSKQLKVFYVYILVYINKKTEAEENIRTHNKHKSFSILFDCIAKISKN